MQFHDLKIVGTQRRSKIYLDGKELKGVTRIEFEQDCLDVARVTISLIIDTHEISITEDEENDERK